MATSELIGQITDEIAEELGNVIQHASAERKYFTRRALDKSCYEVVEDTDPEGPITDTSLLVLKKCKTPELAAELVGNLWKHHVAWAAIEYLDGVIK